MEKHPGNFDSSNKAQHNIPNLCNKYKRYEQSMILQSTALILDNIGFSTASNSVINILSYLLRTYFEKLCRESKSSSEFANRDFVTLEDVSTMFIRHSIDLRELHDYLQQVGSFKLNEPPPLFPLPLSSYKTIVEKQEFENQKEDELTEKADINEKIQVNDDDNEQQDDIKQDHRGLQRFAQKSFPNFFGASASDLGITVKKFVPPLVEIFVEANFLKSTMIEDVSFSIMRPDFFSVPCLSLKGVPESERHKEKRRRKKEKREQQREFNGINEEKQPQFEREKLHETEGIEVKSPDHLKVPKIKIRIGPGPFSAAPLFDLQSTQQIISAGLHSQLPAIDESKIILTQLSTKTEVLQHSTSISTAPDKLKTTRCSSPVQKIILIDDQQTTTPSAKTPPSREDVKKGAKKRKRSPKRAFSLLVETTMKESSIPAIGQDQSSSATDMSQIKDEAKMPDIEKNKRKRNSPKRTSPSPPRRCIRATTPSSKEEVEIMDVNITPIQNNVKKTPALVPPKLLAETKPVPSSVSTVSNILTIPQKQTSSTSKQPKRSRKSEKPTRVDPSIISDVLTQEESPPPGPPPAPSKAMEAILETSKKTEKFLEINKKVNKISDTSLKTPQTSIKKPPINLARLLKPSTALNPQNAAKTLSSGSTSKSKINDKITPVITKSKQKTQKTLTITKTVEKIKEVKNEEKVAVLNKINQSSSTENNFDDDQEEDVWICPVCSVAYVENGPDMVACDTCDRWFHWSCVGILIPPPDNASWYCNECKKKNKKNSGTNSGGNSSRKSSFGGNSNKKRIK